MFGENEGRGGSEVRMNLAGYWLGVADRAWVVK